jgi:alkanesulfonate monooxygenase SsuD/methylene tetrahydromethanopterin reductase-like flavin-dependent oxidoreductase (luciferase family)
MLIQVPPMEIGIGLPTPVRGVTGAHLLKWAQRAEQAGFAAVTTTDRFVYPSYDSLTTLAAVAGATQRIKLVSNILLAPAYPPVLLAKSAASIQEVSAGRLTLGLAPGNREDDFVAVGRNFHTRGRDLDAAVDMMRRAWQGQPVAGGDNPICPELNGAAAIPILFGGHGEPAFRRAVDHGAGWSAGGTPPETVSPIVERITKGWADAGREGAPRLAQLSYYSLGADAEDDSRTFLTDYYRYRGDVAKQIAEFAARTPSAVRDAVRTFEDVGMTEFYFEPTTGSLDQIDRLADLVL